jgi:hypothetical protein
MIIYADTTQIPVKKSIPQILSEYLMPNTSANMNFEDERQDSMQGIGSHSYFWLQRI